MSHSQVPHVCQIWLELVYGLKRGSLCDCISFVSLGKKTRNLSPALLSVKSGEERRGRRDPPPIWVRCGFSFMLAPAFKQNAVIFFFLSPLIFSFFFFLKHFGQMLIALMLREETKIQQQRSSLSPLLGRFMGDVGFKYLTLEIFLPYWALPSFPSPPRPWVAYTCVCIKELLTHLSLLLIDMLASDSI